MNKPLIIGIGNTLRGDDGLGWAAVEKLQLLLPSERAEFLCVPQLTMDLVEAVHQSSEVIFIDARLAEPAGELRAQRIAADSSLELPSTHFFDPQTLLAAVQALYGSHPPAWLNTVNAQAFDYGACLTECAETAVNKLVIQLAARFKVPEPVY